MNNLAAAEAAYSNIGTTLSTVGIRRSSGRDS